MMKEFWIYKVVFADGTSEYEAKGNPLSRASGGAAKLSTLVEMEMPRKAADGFVIHCQPPYDIEVPSKLQPRQCRSLNELEMWEVFKALS